MKVTVFNGSPRGRESNTHLMVAPLLEGARQAGAEAAEVFLAEQRIEHCLGCFACWLETPGQCVQDDDMAPLIRCFVDSDYVGMATPVYGMFMTSLLKKFTERLLPLNTPHIHKSEQGACYHEGRVKRFPHVFMIANSGFPGKGNFDLLKAYMAPQRPALEVYRDCGEALRNQDQLASPDARKRIAEFLDALRQAGAELVARGEAAAATRERLDAALMPDEEYMALVNQGWDEEIEHA